MVGGVWRDPCWNDEPCKARRQVGKRREPVDAVWCLAQKRWPIKWGLLAPLYLAVSPSISLCQGRLGQMVRWDWLEAYGAVSCNRFMPLQGTLMMVGLQVPRGTSLTFPCPCCLCPCSACAGAVNSRHDVTLPIQRSNRQQQRCTIAVYSVLVHALLHGVDGHAMVLRRRLSIKPPQHQQIVFSCTS